MPYVITYLCIGKKDTACYDACPVDAIHPTPYERDHDQHEQLYINPTECIDCGACEPACPHGAIFYESEVPEEWVPYTKINSDYFRPQE